MHPSTTPIQRALLKRVLSRSEHLDARKEQSNHRDFRLTATTVAIGRMYGSRLHSRSNLRRWLECSWRDRAVHMCSRGLCAFHTLRSPTCGPSGVEMRHTLRAGTLHASAVRGAIVMRWARRRVPGAALAEAMAEYRARLTWRGSWGWWLGRPVGGLARSLRTFLGALLWRLVL